MKRLYFYLTFSAIILSVSCSKTKSLSITSIKSPATANSLTPNLFTDSEGTVYLSWIEKQDSLAYLKFSILKEAAWSAPVTIASGTDWFVNWADFPSIIINENNISAHWLQKRAVGTYDYDISIAQSSDGGQTWRKPFIPHQDGIAAEHGFVSMLALNNGQNFATWLDGRNTKPHGQTTEHGHGGAMTLRAGTFDHNGNMLSDTELDHRTCDCCQTTAALTSKGPIVAYRDRSETEIRDIYITREINGVWTAPQAVHNDNWKIEGCPVNGPSISAKGDEVALAWFTASQGFGEVKLAFSDNAGESFTNPIILAKGNTNGRVATSILSDGKTAVSWMETKEEMAYIKLALFSKDKTELDRITVAESSSQRASGFPVITEAGKRLIISWTETEGSSHVRTAQVFFQ